MYSLTQLSAPTILPVSLDDVRRHLAIEDGTHDVALLQQHIPAAVEMFESQTSRQLLTATWRLSLSDFPTYGIKLPKGQYQSLVSVEYSTESDECVDVDISTLRVRGGPDRSVVMAASATGWPSPTETVEQVDVTWVCGWTASTLPKNIKQGILLLTAHYFEQREPVLTGTTSKALEHSLDAIYKNWDLGDEFVDYEAGTAPTSMRY